MAPDTIFALSTGALPSGVAVVRLSGPSASDALMQISGSIPSPRVATLTTLRNLDGVTLDLAMVLYFPAPASFTGENVAELHLHGGRATVKSVLSTLDSLPKLRQADPGEFTRRAFLNGKMDLTEVEGFADLLAAETEMQRRSALIGASGKLRRMHEDWRRRLIKIRALIEADLDFPDEDDVPGSVIDVALGDARQLKAEIDERLTEYRRAEIVRDGFDVVIVGPPNAGKSSLLNALVARDAAIVTDEAGTTRDLIEVVLDLEGYRVRITDTAGLRETSSKVETIGIERGLSRAKEADLVLHLREDGNFNADDIGGAGNVFRILSKVDSLAVDRGASVFDLAVSIDRPESISLLLDRILEAAKLALGSNRDIIPLRARQSRLMIDASNKIQLAIDSWPALEFAGEHLRRASDDLAHVTGLIGTEDLLDAIFREFCIGK